MQWMLLSPWTRYHQVSSKPSRQSSFWIFCCCQVKNIAAKISDASPLEMTTLQIFFLVLIFEVATFSPDCSSLYYHFLYQYFSLFLQFDSGPVQKNAPCGCKNVWSGFPKVFCCTNVCLIQTGLFCYIWWGTETLSRLQFCYLWPTWYHMIR